MKDQYTQILTELRTLLPRGRVNTDALTLSVYSRDASLYRIVPKAVVTVENEEEMCAVMAVAHRNRCPVGYRAAGTSLSGQALTEGLLILQGRGWRKVDVRDGGRFISLEPGIRGSEANAHLKECNRKIGPDPASIDAAKIGGIAANNASGMCCGTKQNTYQTMESMRIVFSDGTLLDTASPASRAQFKVSHPGMIAELQTLSREITGNPLWVKMIQHKYLIKNTTGYAVNSFLDYNDPIDILAHLMVGSEGTLGYISEITYQTVEEFPWKSNALVFFVDIHSACRAVHSLEKCEVNAIELMDSKALQSVADQLSPDLVITSTTTALLIEVQANDQPTLDAMKQQVCGALDGFGVDIGFSTHTENAYAHHWKIRKGMFPSVAAMRAKEETVIIEDVAVPLDHLPDATVAIQQLFEDGGYSEAIIFGHAQAGNLHIVFTQAFTDDAQTQNYHHLMDRLSDLVVNEYNGSLKAEHGTGRNMAPYVKKEWGEEIYALMKRIKTLCDPQGILNPGVVMSDDATIHLKNIKPMPSVHELIDSCMECGFCERVCPSRELSLTPRGRISAMRELAIQKRSLKNFFKVAIEKQAQYQGVDTCATDGMCGEVCPVKIDTGKYVKVVREFQHSAFVRGVVRQLAAHQRWIERITRLSIKAYHVTCAVISERFLHASLAFLNHASKNRIPMLQGALPAVADIGELDRMLAENRARGFSEKVVFYQSCINRAFGQSKEHKDAPDVTAALVSLATKAGFGVVLARRAGACCGLPYSSKGFGETASWKAKESLEELARLSVNGRWPIVVDNAPCSKELIDQNKLGLSIVDSVAWLERDIVGRLTLVPMDEPLALHVVCSARKMGIDGITRKLANRISTNIIEPQGIDCCGFAGDRGFSHPELNRSALNQLPAALPAACPAGLSSSKTCALGLQWNSGRPYYHMAQYLDQISTSTQNQ